jgi:hypothetical protein
MSFVKPLKKFALRAISISALGRGTLWSCLKGRWVKVVQVVRVNQTLSSGTSRLRDFSAPGTQRVCLRSGAISKPRPVPDTKTRNEDINFGLHVTAPLSKHFVVCRFIFSHSPPKCQNVIVVFVRN